MSAWTPGTSTHTPLVPGRRRNHPNPFVVALALGLAGWAVIGVVGWLVYRALERLVTG